MARVLYEFKSVAHDQAPRHQFLPEAGLLFAPIGNI